MGHDDLDDGSHRSLRSGTSSESRSLWSRLRDWDASHQLWTDTGVVCLLLLACFAFPGGFVAQGRKEVLLPDCTDRSAHLASSGAAVGLLAYRRSGLSPMADLSPAARRCRTPGRPLHVGRSCNSLSALLSEPIVLLAGSIMASVRWIPGGNIVKSIVFLTGLLAAALFVGVALRTWRSYMDSLMERTKRLEYESEQQARLAAATERSRIAREMHDVITHSVSIMVTLADGAVATVDAHPMRAKEAMADVSATGRLALTDMRHLLGVFRSEERAARPGTPASALRHTPTSAGRSCNRTRCQVRRSGHHRSTYRREWSSPCSGSSKSHLPTS